MTLQSEMPLTYMFPNWKKFNIINKYNKWIPCTLTFFAVKAILQIYLNNAYRVFVDIKINVGEYVIS